MKLGRVVVLVAATAAVLAIVSALTAHERRTSRPPVVADIKKVGQWKRLLTVRVTDRTSGDPLRDANVTARASMSLPGHEMSLSPQHLVEQEPGTYRKEIQFVMSGPWTITATAVARDSVPTDVRLRLNIPLDEPPDVAASP